MGLTIFVGLVVRRIPRRAGGFRRGPGPPRSGDIGRRPSRQSDFRSAGSAARTPPGKMGHDRSFSRSHSVMTYWNRFPRYGFTLLSAPRRYRCQFQEWLQAANTHRVIVGNVAVRTLLIKKSPRLGGSGQRGSATISVIIAANLPRRMLIGSHSATFQAV